MNFKSGMLLLVLLLVFGEVIVAGSRQHLRKNLTRRQQVRQGRTPSTDKYVTEGDNIEIYCTTTGLSMNGNGDGSFSGKMIHWRKGRRTLRATERVQIAANKHNITINNANSRDSGAYSCNAGIIKVVVSVLPASIDLPSAETEETESGEVETPTDYESVTLSHAGITAVEFRDRLSSTLKQWADEDEEEDTGSEHNGLNVQVETVLDECIRTTKCKEGLSGKATMMAQASEGIAAMSSFAEGMKEITTTRSFTTKIVKLMGTLSPFLGAIGPIVSLFSMFEDSPEFQLIGQVMQVVNEGFARMDRSFLKLSNQVEQLRKEQQLGFFWTHLKTHIETLAEVNRTVTDYLNTTDRDSRKAKRGDLNVELAGKTRNAINILSDAFLGGRTWSYQRNVCAIFTDAANGYRKNIVSMSMFLLELAVKGAEHHQTIFHLLKRGDVYEKETELINLLTGIGAAIDRCDEEFLQFRWQQYWMDALTDKLEDIHADKDAPYIADTIYTELSNQFYFRHWFVVVLKQFSIREYEYNRDERITRYVDHGVYRIFVSSSTSEKRDTSLSSVSCDIVNHDKIWASVPENIKNGYNIVILLKTDNDEFKYKAEDGYSETKSCTKHYPNKWVQYELLVLG